MQGIFCLEHMRGGQRQDGTTMAPIPQEPRTATATCSEDKLRKLIGSLLAGSKSVALQHWACSCPGSLKDSFGPQLIWLEDRLVKQVVSGCIQPRPHVRSLEGF